MTDYCNSPKDCLNYAGLEADLNALIEVCKTKDIDKISRFIEMNYPEEMK